MPGQRGVFPLVPITQVDVYATVRAQLSGLIESGEYRPGDRLPSERELSEALGVSRVAVREALKVLESAGRVTIRRGAGTFVVYPGKDPIAAVLLQAAPVDRRYLKELSQLRAAVELKIVELAVERATPDDVDRLRERLETNAVELDSTPEPGSLNLLFEAELARIADNKLLTMTQHSLHELWVETWSQLSLTPDRKEVLHEEHVKIFEAIAAGDSAGALAEMTRHLDRDLPE